jgi:DNA-binding response OmpR family regulator
MMRKTILVVDDEPLIRQQLKTLFEKYGFCCYQAGSAEEAKRILQQEKIDLATIDVVMPGENGIELTKWIRASINIPVIMLTSLDDNIDTVVGLEIGADDYIAKPFDPRVLLARVNAVIRRYSPQGSDDIQTDKLLLNTNDRCLRNGSNKIYLNAREHQFIKLLLEANSTSVSRDTLSRELFQKEWNPMDRAIDNFVARLRQKIEINPNRPQYIVTVRQIGYMIPDGRIQLDTHL